jgi:transglutaminase-like putative cysteine protease
MGEKMLIRNVFAIEFDMPREAAMIGLLRLHPSLDARVKLPEVLKVEHLAGESSADVRIDEYLDGFGNRCSRFLAPAGRVKLSGLSLVECDDVPDPIATEAKQHPVEELPHEVLQFLLSSRYCQVDQMSLVAGDLFGHTTPGWARAIWIRDWVHSHVRFDYASARPIKTALDVFTERVGVCRDFQHLAITMCRAMNIPARYVTGYLGDIRRPYSGAGDFSAWYEVFLDGRWWPMDARHNDGRMGRVLMAVGRDATDVAITTSFGVANLKSFMVDSYEVTASGEAVPLPPSPAAAG